MRKVFAIEHMRIFLTITFVFVPIIVGAMWLGGVFVITGDGGYEDPDADLYISAAMLTALVLMIGLMLVLIRFLLWPKRYIDDMDRLAAGESWAQWSYDEAEWKAANKVEAARLRRSLSAARIALGIAAVLLIIGLLLGFEDGQTFIFVGGIMIVGVGAMMLIVWLSGAGTFARDGRTGQMSISELGVLRRPGGYSAFAPTGPLKSVEFVAGRPARVVFTTIQSGRYGARTDYQAADILVPKGREDEARALVARFNSEVLKAS
ncbi:hypothetical protein ACFFX1_41165 [Dactylosporangium sucinum]|uniref:Uncharacterized protein n=1 Tax=Dactylosporangium sucinum TaxID=1424081 RepID=A0A917UFB3_9ACTN|nr:hypothetical protein [Dactylosporangium sucinum]GGM82211.1 hypothetical protein GCM10007977_099610 [Dactylosporangium sucinum]